MDMTVDKARHGRLAGAVNFSLAVIAADARHPAARDGDIAGQKFAGKDVEGFDILEHQLGGFAAQRHGQDALLFHPGITSLRNLKPFSAGAEKRERQTLR